MIGVIFPLKNELSSIGLEFDFTSRLAAGENITGQACTADVYVGTDPTPSNIISGAATVSGRIVTQLVVAGVVGVIYLIRCQVSTNLGNQLILQGNLAIVSANPYD